MTLEGYYYVDSEIFEIEREKLWSHSWQMVGRIEEFQLAGNYLSCMVGVEPIVVLSQKSGTLKAMYNICSHRGAELLSGKGNCKSVITCPYHSWTYGLDGQLISANQPDCISGLEESSVKLVEANVSTWGGFVFVHPDMQSESLEEYLADFPAHLRKYHQNWEGLRETIRWAYDEPVNWKLFVENYVEDYHFPTLHNQSLSFYNFQEIQTTLTGKHCQVSIPYRLEENNLETSLQDYKSISYQGYIFPNLMINADWDHVSIFRLNPIGPTRTIIEVIIYQTPQQKETAKRSTAILKDSHERVMQEDLSICRSLQARVKSRAYKAVWPAHDREKGITHFHETLRTYI